MTITSAGDSGDIMYLLNIIKQLPDGPHTLLIEEKDGLTATGRGDDGARKLLAFIGTLIESQPYIKEVRVMRDGDSPSWRSGQFRQAGLHRRNEPLMIAHQNHYNQVTGLKMKVDTSQPWLSVDGDKRAHGRIIVNRTQRYLNGKFPWAKIAAHYGDKLAFVGLPHECALFCSLCGPVEHFPTSTLLEVAQLIKGSELFIGNQSCAFACAEGMKHTSIQETNNYIPDCIFLRPNCQHVWDGACILPAVGDSPELTIHKSVNIGLVSTGRTPPLGWQYPGSPIVTDFFEQMVDEVCRMSKFFGKPRKEAEDAVKQAALDRCPDYYVPSQEGQTVRQAMEFARQYTPKS